MYGFTSFHWDVADLAEPDRRAVEAAPDLEAYGTLLRSADVRARGVSLDQYAYAEAQGRWGQANPMTALDDEVLATARALLATGPDPTRTLADQPLVTAAWNSALGAMAFLPGDGTGDVPRIVEVLRTAGAADLLDDTYAFWALEVRLVGAEAPVCEKVGGWLATAAADTGLPVGFRCAAIGVWGDDRFADRLGHRDALLPLLTDPEIRVSIAAARVLAGTGPAPDLLRAVVAGWPDDAPYPADEVRQSLADADALDRARSAPADPGSLEAFAEHGDTGDVPALLDALRRGPLHGGPYGAAVRHCLRGAGDDLLRLTAARLTAVIADDRLAAAVRVLATQPYWSRSDLSDLTVPVDILVALLDSGDLRLSTAAAQALTGHAAAVPLVRRAAATWPADAPHPADDVRETLADLDALAAARDLVAAASAGRVPAADLHAAVHRVLNDGDDDTDGPALLALIAGDGIAAVLRDADPAQAHALAGKLRSALRWRLPDGAADARYATAVSRLAELTPSMP